MQNGLQQVLQRIYEIETRFAPRSPRPAGDQAVAGATFARMLAKEQANVNINGMIDRYARKYKVDPALARAVAKAESNFDPRATSPAGAMGVMQLMPQTAARLGVQDPYNPEDNVEGGIRYLRQMLDKFNGNTALALAAYNAGPGAVERYRGIPPYGETQRYVATVMEYYRQYK